MMSPAANTPTVLKKILDHKKKCTRFNNLSIHNELSLLFIFFYTYLEN